MQEIYRHRYKLLIFVVSLAIISGIISYGALQVKGSVTLALLFAIIVITAFIRRIDDDLIKIVSYIIMGFSAYSLVGMAYVSLYDPDEAGMIFAQLVPTLLFALVNAVAILITTEDKDIHGYTFAGCGVAVMFVMIVNDLYSLKVQGVLLLMVALWALIPLLWCYLFSEMYRPEIKVTERVARVIGGAIITSPLYIIIAGVTFIAAYGAAPDLPTILEATKSNIFGLGSIILNYALSHLVMVTGSYMLLGLVMYALGYEKKIAIIKKKKEIVYTREERRKEENERNKAEEADPYNQLLTEMKKSRIELKGQDRIKAYQVLQRFSNEYQILHARYGDTQMGDEVKALLRSLENETSLR
ncbi:MAG: hypothetical protein OCU18_02550 [Candidatus Syntrophoarchaeum sp.]|nr:hypothetical protein [Candidatus Syntrophoarchaeum sp.]